MGFFQAANQWLKKLRVDELLDLSQNYASGPQILLRVQTKTASYTVTYADSGTFFTTHGDTNAIVYTLPALPKKGVFFLFFQSVDQNMSVASASANQIKAFNDLDADAVTFVTGSNLIAACTLIFGDGNFWNAVTLGAHTLTVTT
jgi:hypothetical protein